MNSLLTSLQELLCFKKVSPNIQIIINELKTIASSLQEQHDNGTLISILNRLSILQGQLTCENIQKHQKDLTLAVQYAQQLINYINDPLVINPYYSTLNLKLTSSFQTPKDMYVSAIITLLNKIN